jgi:GNAT superfamily N-acetyltransferase
VKDLPLDTVNPSPLLALFDRFQRIDITYPGMLRQEFAGSELTFPNLVRFLRPAPGMSFILYSRLDEQNAEAVIQEQVDYFTAHNLRLEWKVYSHDSPSDLGERLLRRGFTPQEPDAVMLLDLQEAPARLFESPAANLQPITDRQGLAQVIQVLEAVWKDDFSWVTERLGGHLEIPGYLSVYVAYAQGQPACTGWTYFHENNPFASLWGGSTIEGFRKQGLYSALLAARVQEAQRRGVRYLTVDASPMSQPILAKHGFKILTTAQSLNL